MKPTLALLVYTMVLSPAQVQTLPPSLPPGGAEAQTPGLKVPLPEPRSPAWISSAKPARQAAEPPPPTALPLKVPLPEPKGPAELAAPQSLAPPAPTPGVLPPPMLPPEAVPEVPPQPTPCVPCPPVPFPGPPACACRQPANVPPWERRRPPLWPAGPTAGYFVVQDVHGMWPTAAAGLGPQTVPPPLMPAAPPVVRASSHPLPPAEAVMPVVYSAATEAPRAAPPAEKMVIIQTSETKELVCGAYENYRKIVGQVVRVHVHGGRWVVRYAGLDKEDRYGGSVVLDPSADLGRVSEGDVVCVQGEVLNAGRPERPLGAPLFRVSSCKRLGGAKN